MFDQWIEPPKDDNFFYFAYLFHNNIYVGK